MVYVDMEDMVLYTPGVNGISADGGLAGREGKAGEGGKGGNIDIFMRNGIDTNTNQSIETDGRNGNNGKAGKPGKPGRGNLTESRRDYLVVDGRWKKALRYCGFIDAKPYKNTSTRLDRGWYYCDPSVAEHFDSNMKDGYRISSNSFRGIYSFQVLPAAATKRGRLLNEGGYY